MRNVFAVTAALALLSVVVCGPVFAQTWTVATIATDAWLPNNVSFAFDGNQLFLNNTYIYQPGGSSSWNQTLRLCGDWAVCGSVVGGGLIADPYATFVIVSSDVPDYVVRLDEHGCYAPYSDVWTAVGHLSWRSDTPSGHVAHLLLGSSFSGDGAQTYTDDAPFHNTTSGTIVLQDSYHYLAGYYNVSRYDTASYTFRAAYTPVPEPTYVPEPMSVMLAAGGLLSLWGIRRRQGEGHRPYSRAVLTLSLALPPSGLRAVTLDTAPR